MNGEECREVIHHLLQISEPTKADVDAIKLRVAVMRGSSRIIPNSELISWLQQDEREKLLSLLQRKTVRTISGVTVVAVMTKPWPCPHDAPCAYCPGGPSHKVPQSYTGQEPAAMRGMQNQYDPGKQVESRIEQLRAIGHVVDKVELIVMGGTFLSTPASYQTSFIKGCLDALLATKSPNLEEAKKLCEATEIRNVGITVETRPDWARVEHVNQMLSMGVTRVELGVQNIYDTIYHRVGRGHNVGDVIKATQILKDSGLKVLYHLMPGLPGSDFKKDLAGFRTVFRSPDFKPDMIKIYPCLVLKNTKLHEWWNKGEYRPYTTEEAVQLITEVKKLAPPWVRIMRIQRDIPANLIEAGVKKSNLRQLVQRELAQQNLNCRCIRCREVGHVFLRNETVPHPSDIQIFSRIEEASGGVDIFLSAEDQARDILVAYARLRMPSKQAHRQEITVRPSSIIRELHVCGSLVKVGEHRKNAWQHKGYGRVLIRESERIAKDEFDRQKILVMSALGTKRYYMQLGYSYDGPYMSKILR